MNREYPLVSIAIITYNQRAYLKDCIDSALAQDYPNTEIVVSDDGSSDGTQSMLTEYAEEFPGKFVLNLAKKNKGITHNSNMCLSACSGEYIAMLGGDDLLLSGKIAKQVGVLESDQNLSLCGTYTKIINHNGMEIGIRKDYKNKKEPVYSLCEHIKSGNSLVPVVSYMFRRSMMPKEGFDLRLPVASDGLFMRHLASKGNIKVIKEVLTAYRVHDSHARRLGYSVDSLVTHALNEFYFPQCYKSIIYARSKLQRSIALSYSLEKDNYTAGKYLKLSNKTKFSLVTLVLILLNNFKILDTVFLKFKSFSK